MSTILTVPILKAISLSAKPNQSNMVSIVKSLDLYGDRFGLNLAHRLAHYIAQLAHESGHFGYDKEIWGNTGAQKRYEGRKDLGNTQPGDGKKFMGRTGMQLTGRANYEAFYAWCVKEGMDPPDFVDNPDLVNTDPWEGLVPIWFWSVGNSTGKSLNVYADKNDIEMITRKINGGKNGLDNRIEYYTRSALALLGYSVAKTKMEESIKAFQKKYRLTVDGIDGPQTRAKLHEALAITDRKEIAADPSVKIEAAPVTDTKQVAVAAPDADKPGKDYGAIAVTLLTGGGLGFLKDLSTVVQIILAVAFVAAVGYFFWSRRQISQQTKEIKAEVRQENRDGLVS